MKVIRLLVLVITLVILVTGTAFSQAPPVTGRCPCIANMTPTKVSGKIESLAFPMATLKTAKGEIYTLRLGPWWFWQDKGYRLNQGDTVDVEGYKSADFIVPSVIRTSGKEIRLRDANGYPLWGGGKGRRGMGRW